VQYGNRQFSSPLFTARPVADRYLAWGQDRIRLTIPQEYVSYCATSPHDEKSRGGVILEKSNDQGSPFSAVDSFCRSHPRKPLLPQSSFGVAFCGKEGVLTVTATTGEIPTAQSTGKTSPASCFCQKNSLARLEITKTVQIEQSFHVLLSLCRPNSGPAFHPQDPKRINRDPSGRQPKQIASLWNSSSSAAIVLPEFGNSSDYVFRPCSSAWESPVRNTIDFHKGNEVRTLVDGQRAPRQNGECRNQFSLRGQRNNECPLWASPTDFSFLLLTLQ